MILIFGKKEINLNILLFCKTHNKKTMQLKVASNISIKVEKQNSDL